MKQLGPPWLAVFALVAGSAVVDRARAQELPPSGVSGTNYFYATASGSSQFYAVNVHNSPAPAALGAPVSNVPSRWAHRRRTLGALETWIESPERNVFVTPMGSAVGNGALHLVDMRSGVQTALVATGNPAAYDLASVKSLKFVFSAEDDGAGNTLLRGYSYATNGALTPLTPPTLSIAGAPSAYVNRIGVDANALALHVPTVSRVQIVQLSATAPNMTAGPSVLTAPASPTTNPARFDRNGEPTWIIGTSVFDAGNNDVPLEGGYLSWNSLGASDTGTFGTVPTAPLKKWVPAAGTEELGVIGNGTDTYVYYLLREPGPGTFFVKPSSIGVVRYLASTAPTVSTILMPDNVGEPFAIPAVYRGRLAFESSFGPPFIATPPDGGEKVAIIYSPLDPLGASSPYGVLGNPNPLGGRISTRGMDRPIWSPDGTRVMAATSHFPGAPNPAIPGLEVLDVPAGVVLDQFSGPHTVVANLPFPKQSIVFPSVFRPRVPLTPNPLLGVTFFGNVFNQGLASLAVPALGEVGQIQLDPTGFTLPPSVPNFRAIFKPAFNDATLSTTPVPASFGARRTAFNLASAQGFVGLTMSAAIEDAIHVQTTGANLLAIFGVGTAPGTVVVSLPAGSVTTTELLSL